MNIKCRSLLKQSNYKLNIMYIKDQDIWKW